MSIRHALTCITTVALALLFSASPALAATETFHEAYTVEDGTPLTVDNRNGSVTINVWEKETVDVVAKKKTNRGGKLSNVEIQVNIGDAMSIETVYLVKDPRVSVEFSITVPASMSIQQVESSNGAITLEGTTGDVGVRTSNGSIEVRQHAGNVSAQTSNGSIDMKQLTGVVKANTSNGGIDITGAGGIEEAETSNGTISVEVAELHADEVTLKTSNGKIKMFLSPELNADLEMRTSNGKITIHDVEIVTQEVSKTQFKGRIGSGGKTLTAKTSNGSIGVYTLK